MLDPGSHLLPGRDLFRGSGRLDERSEPIDGLTHEFDPRETALVTPGEVEAPEELSVTDLFPGDDLRLRRATLAANEIVRMILSELGADLEDQNSNHNAGFQMVATATMRIATITIA